MQPHIFILILGTLGVGVLLKLGIERLLDELVETMNLIPSKIPPLIALLTGVAVCILVVMVRISGQQPASNALEASSVVFSWILLAVGFVSIVVAVVYGFAKKQKYENLEKERNELKSLAESREERIKELRHSQAEAEAKLQARVMQKEGVITNLRESNSSLVSTSLQMKAILRKLRLEGKWEGHEEEIHETKG